MTFGACLQLLRWESLSLKSTHWLMSHFPFKWCPILHITRGTFGHICTISLPIASTPGSWPGVKAILSKRCQESSSAKSMSMYGLMTPMVLATPTLRVVVRTILPGAPNPIRSLNPCHCKLRCL
uniref:Uncharacterized protein n=1 Tax=Opuntia streptacantha TaxID=393608 RepID=A0A7C9AFN1_OPUST